MGPSWLILGLLRATFGRLGLSRGEDRRRHSRCSKICTSLTREHHFGLVSRFQLGPFWDHFRLSRGHLVHIDHLGVRLGLSCVISGLPLPKTDDAKAILQNWHLAYTRAPFFPSWRRFGTILGPSSGRLGTSRDDPGSFWAFFGSLWALSGPLGERTDDGIADFAKIAFRLHESTIFRSPRGNQPVILGPSWVI